ncbi:hypothetical protein DENSPDRAFT_653206 [Dentipellis sp. KUC8613]|nr:hypothetical protein DENSPDRAFT_653206 [Dentipellis sp. KUC8613]
MRSVFVQLLQHAQLPFRCIDSFCASSAPRRGAGFFCVICLVPLSAEGTWPFSLAASTKLTATLCVHDVASDWEWNEARKPKKRRVRRESGQHALT